MLQILWKLKTHWYPWKDYAKNYTDVSYRIDFDIRKSGNGIIERTLSCENNSKQDATNICECDKRFAETIASLENECSFGVDDHFMYGSYCMDENYRTLNGGGRFDPHIPESCDKQNKGLNRDKCCGIYPDRLVVTNYD